VTTFRPTGAAPGARAPRESTAGAGDEVYVHAWTMAYDHAGGRYVVRGLATHERHGVVARTRARYRSLAAAQRGVEGRQRVEQELLAEAAVRRLDGRP